MADEFESYIAYRNRITEEIANGIAPPPVVEGFEGGDDAEEPEPEPEALERPLPPVKEHPADYRYETWNIDSVFRPNMSETTTDFTYKSPKVRNVISARITSYEIPNTSFMFSESRGNLRFAVTQNGVRTVYRIKEGNYATADELLTALSAPNLIPTGCPLSFTYYVASNTNMKPSQRIQMSTTGSALQVDFTDTFASRVPYNFGLGYHLGFRSLNFTVAAGLPIIAPFAMDFSNDRYYLLQVGEMGQTNHAQRFNALAKILVNAPKNGIITYDAASPLKMIHNFTQPTTISDLRVRLLDLYGEPVNLNDQNMSFTIEFTQIMHADVSEYHRRYQTVPRALAQAQA